MENNKIEEKIVESLKEMSKYNCEINKEKRTRIILPNYREKTDCKEKKLRYSEQELKQIFLLFIEKDTNFYYTVETPSKFLYSFSYFDEPKIEKNKSQKEHFESARFDTSLYSSPKLESLLCHVEFKHKNPSTVKEISKDLVKLTNELGSGGINYFVHYIIRSSNWKSKSFPCIMDKYKKAISIEDNNEKNLGKVIVYLMFYDDNNGDNTILKFDLKTFLRKYKTEIKDKNYDENDFNWMVVSK